jgi:hypothetical protein
LHIVLLRTGFSKIIKLQLASDLLGKHLMKMKTALLIATIFATMNFSSAFAAEDVETQEMRHTYKVFDILVVRPLGFALTLAGSGLYLATIPVTVISGDSEDAAEVLVRKPARMAFGRR